MKLQPRSCNHAICRTYIERTQVGTMYGTRLKPISLLPLAVVYVPSHVLLDWLSYVHPFGAFGITPWNPSTGLGFVLVLLQGTRALPVLFTALLVSNLAIRGMPVPLWMAMLEAIVVGAGYASALLMLLRPSVRFDVSLSSVRDVFLLFAASVASSAIVASTYVWMLIATDLLPVQDLRTSLLRYWVAIRAAALRVLLSHRTSRAAAGSIAIAASAGPDFPPFAANVIVGQIATA